MNPVRGPRGLRACCPEKKECHSSWLCPNSHSSVCNKALVAEPQSMMVRSQDTDMTISSPSERMSQRSKVCIETSVVESQRDPTSKIWRGWPWSFAGWPSALESISQLLVAVRIPKRMFFYDTIKSQQKSLPSCLHIEIIWSTNFLEHTVNYYMKSMETIDLNEYLFVRHWVVNHFSFAVKL